MSITMLSAEIVTMVCSYLERPEWAALRLACSWLYLASLDAFTSQYFRSICFIATSNGIRELEDLALSENIRGRVREVWMIPTLFEGRHDKDLVHFRSSPLAVSSRNGEKLEGEKLQARYEMYQAIVADHRALLESEDFSARLRNCFARFNNLEAIGLKHYTTSFLLDRQQYEVRCLGVRPLRDQVDFVFQPSHSCAFGSNASAKANSLAISRLFQALEGCNQKIKRLYTCGINICGRIPPKLSLSRAEYDSFLLSLENLEHLHMCISYDRLIPKKRPTSISSVNILLTVAPKLKTLVFSQSSREQRATRYHYFLDIAQSIKFTQLRGLHLHWIEIQFESFKSFLHTAKTTLDTLTLEWVSMNDNLPPMTGQTFRWASDSRTAGMEALWQRTWRCLGDDLSLRTFSMENLGYRDMKVFIVECVEGPQKSASTRFDEEAGISFHEWISRLKAVVTGERYELCDISPWAHQLRYDPRMHQPRRHPDYRGIRSMGRLSPVNSNLMDDSGQEGTGQRSPEVLEFNYYPTSPTEPSAEL